MKFDSAQAVLTEVTQMLLSQQQGMKNRTMINRLFNGDAPNSEEERRAENLKTNANWLEGTRIAQNATNQINNSFFKGDRFFTVNVDKGPARMRSQWSSSITVNLNRLLKRSRAYRSARESAHAQVVLHGPGPLLWRNRRSPIPTCSGVEDVILPSGTLASMENLDRFGIYRELTWSQLLDATKGPETDPGWNKNYVTALLATLYKTGIVPIYQGNRWLFPEKTFEDVKEGAAAMASSSLPKLLAWDFFYRDEDNGKWSRCMVVDYGNIASSGIKESDPVAKTQDFLYFKKDYAEDWSEIIHWYIGNCSNVAPYRYYSIRSIGYLLYGVCMAQNKMRNRLYDHMFQSLLTLFRNISDDNREKLGMIDLQNFGVLPEGVSMVPAGERHVVDWNLIMMGLNQGRQLMAESSAAFIPDMDKAMGQPQMTATEAMIRNNTSVTLTSAVLNQLADQSVYESREICRRFCLKTNPDPMAKLFRERIQEDGVPLDMLDIEAWDILPEQTVGGGNKAVELTVTQALMQEMFPLAGPDGQRIIARRRYMALTDNPEEAMEVIGEAPAPPSDDVQYGQMAFPVLMLGVPFQVKEGVNRVAYASTLMQLMDVTIQQIEALLQTPTGVTLAAEKIAGVAFVGQHCEEQVQMISQGQKEVAKIMEKVLFTQMATIKTLAQQLMQLEQQNQQQQGGPNPEVMAKIQERLMLAETNNKIKEQAASKKQEQKDVAFESENVRRTAMTAADIQRMGVKTQAEVASKDAMTAADILRQPVPTNE